MTREEELYLREKELLEQLEQVKAEKKQLRKLEIDAEKEANAKRIAFLREHRDFILSNLKHSCGTCSDKNPHINGFKIDRGYAQCTKCFLTEILDGEYGDDRFMVNFNFNIVGWRQ